MFAYKFIGQLAKHLAFMSKTKSRFAIFSDSKVIGQFAGKIFHDGEIRGLGAFENFTDEFQLLRMAL